MIQHYWPSKHKENMNMDAIMLFPLTIISAKK